MDLSLSFFFLPLFFIFAGPLRMCCRGIYHWAREARHPFIITMLNKCKIPMNDITFVINLWNTPNYISISVFTSQGNGSRNLLSQALEINLKRHNHIVIFNSLSSFSDSNMRNVSQTKRVVNNGNIMFPLLYYFLQFYFPFCYSFS